MKETFLKLFIAVFALGVFVTLHDGLVQTTNMFVVQPSTLVAQTAGGSATTDLKANGSDGPVTVPYGSNVSLTWSVSDARINWCSFEDLVGANLHGTPINRSLGSAPPGQLTINNLTTAKTYKVFCIDDRRGADVFNTYTDSVVVNVVPPPPPPPPAPYTVDIKVNGSDGPISVPYKSNVTLSWTAIGDLPCTASGWDISHVPTLYSQQSSEGLTSGSGTRSIGPLTKGALKYTGYLAPITDGSYTFSLVCYKKMETTGSYYPQEDSVTVTVLPDPNPFKVELLGNGKHVPTLAQADSKIAGSVYPQFPPLERHSDLVLSWNVSGADADLTCRSNSNGNTTIYDPDPDFNLNDTSNLARYVNNGWNEKNITAPTGQVTIRNMVGDNPTYNYSLFCSDRGQTASDAFYYNVVKPTQIPDTVTLLANGQDREITVARGTNVLLTWEVKTPSNPDKSATCGASGSWSGGKSKTGREFINSVTSNGVYTISCSGSGGGLVPSTVRDTVTIYVTDKVTTPTTPTQPTTPTTPKTLTCDSVAKAIVTAAGGCSNVDQTEYQNVYSACCTLVTKTTLLQILNSALSDGVIDATEKKSLLSALNSYLSK